MESQPLLRVHSRLLGITLKKWRDADAATAEQELAAHREVEVHETGGAWVPVADGPALDQLETFYSKPASLGKAAAAVAGLATKGVAFSLAGHAAGPWEAWRALPSDSVRAGEVPLHDADDTVFQAWLQQAAPDSDLANPAAARSLRWLHDNGYLSGLNAAWHSRDHADVPVPYQGTLLQTLHPADLADPAALAQRIEPLRKLYDTASSLAGPNQAAALYARGQAFVDRLAKLPVTSWQLTGKWVEQNGTLMQHPDAGMQEHSTATLPNLSLAGRQHTVLTFDETHDHA
ncbi:MAG: hypothetical protein ACYCW6_13865, partial [Candidatus Xenobia bacterium]